MRMFVTLMITPLALCIVVSIARGLVTPKRHSTRRRTKRSLSCGLIVSTLSTTKA